MGRASFLDLLACCHGCMSDEYHDLEVLLVPMFMREIEPKHGGLPFPSPRVFALVPSVEFER